VKTSHKEQLKRILAEAGIDYTEEIGECFRFETYTKGVEGYAGFNTCLYFDESGQLTKMDIAED